MSPDHPDTDTGATSDPGAATTKRGGAPALLVPFLGAVLRPIQRFFHLEASSGIVLLAAAVAAFVWANWPGSAHYTDFVDLRVAAEVGRFTLHTTLKELINDGLMTIFFLVVGLEIKRELVRGELNTPARALLPAIAALGGMLVPAAVFAAFTHGRPGAAGWGIPMATDIAFTIGCLSLLRSRVPYALVVFVTALAIFDDIGGILVIAVFYGTGIHVSWLLAAGGIVLIGLLLNRLRVQSFVPYAMIGVALWMAMHHAGIHATLAGVVLGMLVPARLQRPPREVLSSLGSQASELGTRADDEELASAELAAIESELEDLQSPLDRFVRGLHGLVAFFIMPAFALVNAGVNVSGMGWNTLLSPVALGVGLGLFAGKQIGIFATTAAAVKMKLAPMPTGASFSKVYGVAIVAGIGFTVALFIATLAYPHEPALLDEAKIGILVGSLLAGVVGCAALLITAPTNRRAIDESIETSHPQPDVS